MANHIYSTTLGGLSELVSPRVAEGVLRRALAAVAVSEDEVDARTMSRLLRGRIRRDLERTLPRAGLRRSLAELDARLLRGARSVAAAPSSAPGAPGAPGDVPRERPAAAAVVAPEPTRWRHEPRDESELPVRKRAFPIASDGLPAPRRAGASAEAAPRAEAASPATAVLRPPPPAERPGPAGGGGAAARPRPAEAAASVPREPRYAVPAAAVARVAEQDGVRQWVWASPAPGAEGRGEGPEPARVDGEVRAIVSLLARHGRLSTLHVRHGTGQVLVGVHGPSALVVAGDEGINVGAIYATFRALEEES